MSSSVGISYPHDETVFENYFQKTTRQNEYKFLRCEAVMSMWNSSIMLAHNKSFLNDRIWGETDTY